MRLVHYYPTAGQPSGVTAAILGWAHASRASGIDTVILYEAAAGSDVDGDMGWPVKHRGARRQTRIPVGLRAELNRGDVLILHEGWVSSNHYAGWVARRAEVPYIVVPHGVYEPNIRGGLMRPRWVRSAAERRLIRGALAVHVFFRSEMRLVRAVCRQARMMIAPTGWEPGPGDWGGNGGYLAWFGRYDIRHKGLDRLVEALAYMPIQERPRLRLRGYDFLGGKTRLRQLVSDLGLDAWVEIGGRIDNEDKTDFLLQASAYVHPSRWESHSIALLECLGLGIPCVVSDRIHVAQQLHRADAAVVCGLNPEELTDGIRQGWNSRDLGERGRRYVQQQFSWPRVMRDFLNQLELALDNRGYSR